MEGFSIIEEREFYLNLGKGLRKLRKEKKKSQTEVAQSIRVTFQQLQKYEKALNRPKEFYSRKIVEYLGMDYEQFLKENNVLIAKNESNVHTD